MVTPTPKRPRGPPCAPSLPLAPHLPALTRRPPEARSPPQQHPRADPSGGLRFPSPPAHGLAPSRTWGARQAAAGFPALGLPWPIAIDTPFRLVATPEEERRGSAEGPSCCCHSGRGHVPLALRVQRTWGSRRRKQGGSLQGLLKPRAHHPGGGGFALDNAPVPDWPGAGPSEPIRSRGRRGEATPRDPAGLALS